MHSISLKNLQKLGIAFLVIVVLGFSACQESTEEDPLPSTDTTSTDSTEIRVTENPNPPENNDAIVSQQTWGDENESNRVLKMENKDNDIYYIGQEGSNYFFGKIDQFGQVEWKRQLSFTPTDFQVSPSSSDIVIVGFNGSKGELIAYDNSGNEIKTLTIEEPGYEVILRGIDWIATIESDFPNVDWRQITSYRIVGAVKNSSSILFPYDCSSAVTYKLDGSIEFEKSSSKIHSNYPNHRFNEIRRFRLPDLSGGDIGSPDQYLISGNVGTDFNESDKVFTFCFDSQLNSLLWSRDIIDNSGLKSIIPLNGSIVFTENPFSAEYAYIIARTEFEKAPAPSGGGYWQAGLFAKLNLENGNIEWQKSHSFSNKSDIMRGGFAYNGNLYAYGSHSQVFFNYEDETNAFGNGILAKINPTNGDLISSSTFGDVSYQSRINTAFALDNKLYLGGFTNYSGEGSSQNWFVVMNP